MCLLGVVLSPKQQATPSAQIFDPKYHSPLKKSGLFGEMANSWVAAGKVQGKSRKCCCSKEIATKDVKRPQKTACQRPN